MHLKQPIVPKMPHVFERLAAELFGIPAGGCVVGAEAAKRNAVILPTSGPQPSKGRPPF